MHAEGNIGGPWLQTRRDRPPFRHEHTTNTPSAATVRSSLVACGEPRRPRCAGLVRIPTAVLPGDHELDRLSQSQSNPRRGIGEVGGCERPAGSRSDRPPSPWAHRYQLRRKYAHTDVGVQGYDPSSLPRPLTCFAHLPSAQEDGGVRQDVWADCEFRALPCKVFRVLGGLSCL